MQSDCEKIILKNGELLEVNISEISETTVRYKPCDKPDHPDFTMSLENVLSILARDGSIAYRSEGAALIQPAYSDTYEEPKGLFSMILGLSGLVSAFLAPNFGWLLLPLIGWILLVVGVVLGLLSIREVNKHPTKYRGSLFAWIGISAAILTLMVFTIIYLFYGLLFSYWL